MKLGFVFCPGWAMPVDFFVPLQKILSHSFPQASYHLFDLGYFNTEPTQNFDWSNATHWFGIGHSYGLIRLLRLTQFWHGLVSICGFTHYSAAINKIGVAPESLQMLQKLVAENCAAGLRYFHRQCNLPATIRPNHMLQKERILTDLNDLAHCYESPITTTLALASRNDAIVPTELTCACFAESTIHWHEYAGHALGLLDPDWCAARIGGWISSQISSNQEHAI